MKLMDVRLFLEKFNESSSTGAGTKPELYGYKSTDNYDGCPPNLKEKKKLTLNSFLVLINTNHSFIVYPSQQSDQRKFYNNANELQLSKKILANSF